MVAMASHFSRGRKLCLSLKSRTWVKPRATFFWDVSSQNYFGFGFCKIMSLVHFFEKSFVYIKTVLFKWYKIHILVAIHYAPLLFLCDYCDEISEHEVSDAPVN